MLTLRLLAVGIPVAPHIVHGEDVALALVLIFLNFREVTDNPLQTSKLPLPFTLVMADESKSCTSLMVRSLTGLQLRSRPV